MRISQISNYSVGFKGENTNKNLEHAGKVLLTQFNNDMLLKKDREDRNGKFLLLEKALKLVGSTAVVVGLTLLACKKRDAANLSMLGGIIAFSASKDVENNNIRDAINTLGERGFIIRSKEY